MQTEKEDQETPEMIERLQEIIKQNFNRRASMPDTVPDEILKYGRQLVQDKTSIKQPKFKKQTITLPNTTLRY